MGVWIMSITPWYVEFFVKRVSNSLLLVKSAYSATSKFNFKTLTFGWLLTKTAVFCLFFVFVITFRSRSGLKAPYLAFSVSGISIWLIKRCCYFSSYTSYCWEASFSFILPIAKFYSIFVSWEVLGVGENGLIDLELFMIACFMASSKVPRVTFELPMWLVSAILLVLCSIS